MKLAFLTLLNKNVFLGYCMLFATISFAQNSTKTAKLIGEISTLNVKARITKSGLTAKGKHLFKLYYTPKGNDSSKEIPLQFKATPQEYVLLFDQIKEVFKSRKAKKIDLGRNYQLGLSMLTPSDLQLTVFKKNKKVGSFTTSATGLHLLFGQNWDKAGWNAYLKP